MTDQMERGSIIPVVPVIPYMRYVILDHAAQQSQHRPEKQILYLQNHKK